MIVDDLRTEERDDTLERSARVRWDGDQRRLRFSVPAPLSAPLVEGTPFLAACLLQAMRRGEDLEIDAPVSSQLVATAEEAQTIYRCWAPSLRRAKVKVAAAAPARKPAAGFGCFFSRGVDSMFSAASEHPGRITHLIFIADLDPINDERQRAEEVRLARKSAALLDLPLVVAGTNLRRLSARILDWADLVGAGLAAMGHCLDGGLARVLVPSSCDWTTLGPSGTSPVLDHLFSSETMRIEHGDMGKGRHGKVAWLVRERPDLLPLLKVCFSENRTDNCGKCRKCLWTMSCLEAAAALEQSSTFPSSIDLARIRAMRPPDLPARLFWLQTAEALEAAGRSPELSDAIRHALDRCARPSLRDRVRARYALIREGERNGAGPSSSLFLRNQTEDALTVLRGGGRIRRG